MPSIDDPGATITDTQKAEAQATLSITPRNETIGLAKLRKGIIDVLNGSNDQNLTMLAMGDSFMARIGTDLVQVFDTLVGDVTQTKSIWGDGLDGIGVQRALEGSATETTFNYTYLPNGRFWTVSASGDAVRFYASNAQPQKADVLKIYYLRTNGGGNFKIQSSNSIASGYTDETGFTNIATDNGGADELGIATIPKSFANYAIRPEWVSGGPVIILGAAWINDSTKTIDVPLLNISGQSPGDCATANAQMTADLIADLDPDVIPFMFDDVASALEPFCVALDSWITTSGIVYPAVLAFGSNPKSATADNLIEDANRVAQQYASRYGWYFVDGFAAAGGSFATLSALGWGGDGTHANDDYYSMLTGLMIQQLGIQKDLNTFVDKLVNYQDVSLDAAVTLRKYDIRKDATQNPALVMRTDNTFGTQASFEMNAGILFRNSNSSTTYWIMSPNQGITRDRMPSGTEVGASGPRIIADSGVPSVSAPNGSIYMRTDGGAGTTFYVRESGAWVAK